MESMQNKLSRVRKPRIHITYEVETEGAQVEKELPFVIGVLGDFSGQSTKPLKPLKERKFVQIDRDNFNQIMKNMAPGLSFKVDNLLQNDNSELTIDLNFESMDDFEPANIIKQLEPLKKLLDSRNKLRDLLAKVDRSEVLEEVLEQILANPENLKKVSSELGIDSKAKPEEK
jgi:type VI secretion system protein ImpB